MFKYKEVSLLGQHLILFPDRTLFWQEEKLLVVADLTRHQHDWVRDRLADQWLGFSYVELEGWLEEAGLSILSYQEYGDLKQQQTVFLLAAGNRQ